MYQTIDMTDFMSVAKDRFKITCFGNQQRMADLQLHQQILAEQRVIVCDPSERFERKILKGFLDNFPVGVELMKRQKDFSVIYTRLQELRGGRNFANFIVRSYLKEKTAYLMAFDADTDYMETLTNHMCLPFWSLLSWDVWAFILRAW